MTLNIDNACYGALKLEREEVVASGVFYILANNKPVSFKLGYDVIFSSGEKVGKLYCGKVEEVDVDNQTVTIDGNTLNVSNFEYFARVGSYA